MKKVLLAAMLLAGSCVFAAAPASAAPACQGGYPYYCETVKYDTPVYANPDSNGQVFYTAHAGDVVEVTIDSCKYGFIWGADDNAGRTTGWFPNEALSFSPCYLVA